MGRRKRRDNPRKRSLLFEESPVNSGQLALSPVLCADNPVTAVSVPIDGHCSISWVSPQFDGITVSCRKRRQARRQQNTSNAQGDRSLREKSRRKFPSLQFVGEAARSSRPSALRPVRTLTGEGCVSSAKENALNGNVSDGNNEEDDVCAEVVRRRVSVRKSVHKDHRPSVGRCSVFLGRLSCSSADSSLEQPVPALQRKSPAESTHVCSVLHSQTRSRSKGGNARITSVEKRGNKRKGYDSDILLSPLETSSLSQSGKNTPVTAGVVPVPLRVALFAHSPSEDAFSTSANAGSPLFDSSNNSLLDNVSRGRKSFRTSKTAEEGKLSDSEQAAHSVKVPRRSKRLQERQREAMKYLQPGTPGEKSTTNILVSDTPETEYSLSYRQRQRLKKTQICK